MDKRNSAAPLSVPHRLVPASKLHGRDAVISELSRLITGAGLPPRSDRPRAWVLHGIGGSGKTTVAREVAQRAKAEGVDVWWLNGASGNLPQDMHAVGYRVGAMPESLSRQHAADGIWERLDKHEGRWLLVIDNVVSISDLETHEQPFSDGTGWIRQPASNSGFVLVTSKLGDQRSWGSWCHLEQVKSLNVADGGKVLRDRIEASLGERGQQIGGIAESEELAAALAGLPLALVLAADYLARAVTDVFPVDWVPRTYGAYQRVFEQGLELRPDDGLLTPVDEHHREVMHLDFPIVTSWDMALDLLDRGGIRFAGPLLRLLACFGPAPIPYAQLVDAEVLARTDVFPACSRADLRAALEGLRSVGLVELSSSNGTSDRPVPLAELHPLVRRTNRLARDVTRRHDLYRSLLATLLTGAIAKLDPPGGEEYWPLWEFLRPHCTSPLDLGRHLGGQLRAEDVLRLSEPAQNAGTYLQARGYFGEAQRAYRQVFEERSVALGPEHPQTLGTLEKLAGILHDLGQPMESEQSYRAVLEVRQRLLGDEHIDTICTRQHIAEALRDRGMFEDAGAEYRNILDVQTRLHGPDDPVTLETRENYAFLLHSQGSYKEAAAQYDIVLRGFTDRLGPMDRLTLTTKHNYARLQQDMGDIAVAKASYREVRDERQARLGESHPDTLSTRHALAYLLHMEKQFDEAAEEYEKIYEIQVRNLGLRHRDTLSTRYNYGILLRDRGEPNEARNVLTEVYSRRNVTLGAQNPETLTAWHAVATLRSTEFDDSAAARELEAIVEDQTTLLGADHPSTLQSIHDLAMIRQDRNELELAFALFKQVHERRRATLGEDHPATRDAGHSVAYARHLLHDDEGALADLRRILDAEVHHAWPRQGSILALRHNIARVLHGMNRLAEAEVEIQGVLKLSTELLGPQHGDTDAANYTLGRIQGRLQEQSDGSEAEG